MNLTEKGKLREILKHLNKIENLSSNLEIKKLCQSIEVLLDEAFMT